MNQNQKLVLWVGGILTLLSAVAQMWISTALFAILTAVAWKKFDTKGRKPENAVVKSVRCGNCGAIGEPHWAKCPQCGASAWK